MHSFHLPEGTTFGAVIGGSGGAVRGHLFSATGNPICRSYLVERDRIKSAPVWSLAAVIQIVLLEHQYFSNFHLTILLMSIYGGGEFFDGWSGKPLPEKSR